LSRAAGEGGNEIPISRQPPVKYPKLKAVESTFEEVISHLDLYAKNAARKGLLMHDEMERHYLQPLSRKLEKSVSGPAYTLFLEKKSRAVSEFDTATSRCDSFHSELPQIPNIQVDASELKDPTQKYSANVANERRLATIIAESHGVRESRPQLQERDPMNLRKWRILKETRFYEGVPGGKKGKRVDPNRFRSNVATVLDAFTPNERPPIKPRRAHTSYMRDHLAEEW
jgi:hypothetical protein